MRIDSVKPRTSAGDSAEQGYMARLALGFTAWAEKWFPDSFIFVAVALVIVATGAMVNGAGPMAVSKQFGLGFWSLIATQFQGAFNDNGLKFFVIYLILGQNQPVPP